MSDTIRALVALAENVSRFTVESTLAHDPLLDVEYSDGLGDTWEEFLEQQSDIVISVYDENGQPAGGVLAFALSGEGLVAASTDAQGNAKFSSIDDALPHLVAAQRSGGAWAFGIVRAGEPSRATFPRQPSALVVRAAASGALNITAPNGFPLERVLPMLGIVPRLSTNGTLTLGGIPAGTYTVAVGPRRQTVAVRSGETAMAKFE